MTSTMRGGVRLK